MGGILKRKIQAHFSSMGWTFYSWNKVCSTKSLLEVRPQNELKPTGGKARNEKKKQKAEVI